MIVKRKLFSFIDEDGNQGYYLYNESTGEEKLFSVVEEEREFANTRLLKKGAKTFLGKSVEGNLTTKDVMRIGKLKGVRSLKALENPNYDKVVKGVYNKANKLSKGELGELVSKPEFINQSRTNSRALSAHKSKLNKGDVKSLVDYANRLKDTL